MPIINGYATLADYKLIRDIDSVDTDDDSVLEQLIESASGFINDQAGRTFYPRVEQRFFDVPQDRELWLDDDLLEVIQLTNGDTTVIAGTQYYLKPRNDYPKYALQLKESSSVSWQQDADGNHEYVIGVQGYWGFHDQYLQRGWTAATQVNKIGGINTTENPLTVDLGTAIAPGRIFKIGDELMICTANTPTTVTVLARGDNGSTAATHADDSVLYLWNPMTTIKLACLEIVKGAYGRRFGTNTQGIAKVTATGIVITPEEVPATAWKIIERYKRFR